ncbi:MAG TPA: aminoglycoside phosphotransferase family protein [Gemmataceae bacterium]
MTSPSLDIEDPAAFLPYLKAAKLVENGDPVATTALPGGVSSRTVSVDWPDGRSCVFKQALPKLRVAVDWFSDPSRVHREALALRYLGRLAPAGTVPRLVFEDAQQHVIGMEAVPRPHDNWKNMLLAGRLVEDHVHQFGEWLGAVHRRSSVERGNTASAFDDRSFFESLRVEPYYHYTASQVPEAAAFYDRLIADTRGRRLALVHGDFSPKNVLVHANRLVLLDFEVIHWGDPAFDIGFGLTHLLSKAHHLPDLRAEFGRAASLFYRSYRQALGAVPWSEALEACAVRHTLGCLLARVAGRSPLEYLEAPARQRQRRIVLALIARPPASVDDLVGEFLARVEE